jgi:hypothetical protein
MFSILSLVSFDLEDVVYDGKQAYPELAIHFEEREESCSDESYSDSSES